VRELYPAPEPSETPGPEASWVRDGDGEADQTLEENWLFRLRRERYRSRASDKAHAFYVIHLADAVNVIALTPDRQVILVRQFRAGSGRDSLETPGGLVDEGEDPLEAGARELLEETGYAGDPAELLGTVWSNPSLLTSRSTTILIENARRVAEPRLDHGEEVAIELVPEGSIPRMIQDGRIDHSLVVCGLLWWLQSRFPGRLAKPGPPLAVKIATVMKAIAAIAVCLSLLVNLRNPTGHLTLVGILAFAAFLALSWPGLWKSLSAR
jgi:8-oxo-dGTP pyrophosphatase MutT (NUDIX family)